MSKNILMRSLYKINSTQWFRDRADEGDLFDLYMQMHEISLRSFEKHLQGDWEFRFYTKEVDNIQQVFQDHFFETYELWRQGHNILYCGPDNMMMKPTQFFDQYDDFRMFNYTDPKHAFGMHFLNADVRYYPADMPENTWSEALVQAENWDFDEWNTEQIILNKMLWRQEGRTLENTVDPKMAYQGHMLYLNNWEQTMAHSNAWNNCDINDAHIIHLHGSRNAPAKLALMKELEKLS